VRVFAECAGVRVDSHPLGHVEVQTSGTADTMKLSYGRFLCPRSTHHGNGPSRGCREALRSDPIGSFENLKVARSGLTDLAIGS
jgi:hypothetical protein